MGKIALSQNTSLDGVMQLDGLMQSPGPTDVPFNYTGGNLTTSTAVPRVADSLRGRVRARAGARTPRRSCSAGSPTRSCGPSGPPRKVSSPTG
jgi:hypothetical protein